ncbi:MULTISPECIES: cation:dicarboxylate symporter family transporter [unclassified Romboutsia]|uniref:cation:dicarboxylate symporter family transporter n=1 Tax=unclassified Romboutsia TaxID=2626894 RepID=UPI001FAE22F2|nr:MULTISPECIES: cation:dicarboxylase symporter family transporter [unclassified Romboutsia]MDB8804891.1 cation:dicarboxylase symporter family transporter [Romboutsia sp. 1001216sp1]MDB8809048.1 cation:dicarboxylase symporter family transporter [Romboutsia sp. 1001216sp1]MDB8810537.1 cation:dicarboxylase symporter family transporter [Romboutsia sp. 1001216sp1]MDB8816256.1 cation:dicarboxylase symporter family transporter [Romboutsia sp. 1001216sp1]MDB8818790.1 cation:dicarboxylase symporter fa
MGESSFLTGFLMISNIKTIIFIALLIGTFFIVKHFEKKKVKFSTRTIYATIIGLILGVIIQLVAGLPEDPSQVDWLQEVSKWYGLFGYGFMDLLKMLVVPMVFVSIIRVIINMKEGDNLQALTFKSLGMLLGTTCLAAIIGIVVGNVMKLGVGFEATGIEAPEMREITPLVDTLRGLLPSNPVLSMADGNIVAIIIFATFLGLATNRTKKKYMDTVKPFIDLVEAFYKIIVSVAMTVIKFMPYAVVALLANTITARGLSSMISVVQFVVALYVATAILFVVHLIIIAACGLNPITYIKNAAEPLLLAFTSRSSLGTLPVTIDTLVKKHGVEEGVASFTASLGANMGMNGCAGIYPALMGITVANMAGIDKDISFYVMLLVVITISSLGIAGLPGTATMAVSVVVSGVGLGAYFPLAGGILAIDPILDMGRTMINVNGASVTSIAVGNSLGKIDKDIYNRKNTVTTEDRSA